MDGSFSNGMIRKQYLRTHSTGISRELPGPSMSNPPSLIDHTGVICSNRGLCGRINASNVAAEVVSTKFQHLILFNFFQENVPSKTFEPHKRMVFKNRPKECWLKNYLATLRPSLFQRLKLSWMLTVGYQFIQTRP